MRKKLKHHQKLIFSTSRSVKSVIFVVNCLNLGQAGLLGVKLCECLKILEQTSRDSNQVTDTGLSLVGKSHVS